jgi:hypothetical protein
MFPTRKDFNQSWSSAPTLGGTTSMFLTNEFHIFGINIIIPLTVSGSGGTAVKAGLLEILQLVRVIVPDAGNTRDIVNASGSGLIERAAVLTGRLDAWTNAARNTSGALPAAGSYVVSIPIDFRQNLTPPANLCTIIPAPTYSSKVEVQCQFATVAQMTTGGTHSVALNGTPTIEIMRVRVPNSVQNFGVYKADIIERQYAYTATGQNIIELDVPGSYTDLTIRNFRTADNVRMDILDGGDAQLKRLGNVIERWNENTLGLATRRPLNFTAFDGLFLRNFVGEPQEGIDRLDSILDGNIGVASGARVQLLQNIGVLSYQKIIGARIFGNLAALRSYSPADVV